VADKDQRNSERIVQLEERIKSVDNARALQAVEYERWLDELKQAAAELERTQSEYLRRDEFRTFHDVYQRANDLLIKELPEKAESLKKELAFSLNRLEEKIMAVEKYQTEQLAIRTERDKAMVQSLKTIELSAMTKATTGSGWIAGLLGLLAVAVGALVAAWLK
jgi:hypothetical protein